MRSLSAVLVFLLTGTSPLAAETAIVVALPAEADGMHKAVRLVGQPISLAQHKISIGYHKGEKIYIVRTGAGIINATMTTQALLTRYRVDRLISIGVAGNLRDDWKIGDILIATGSVNHQQGKETASGFDTKANPESSSGGQLSDDYNLRCERLRNDASEAANVEFSQAAKDAASPEKANVKGATAPASVRTGCIASGDSFIASRAKRKWLRDTSKADAVDMVSAGIARVCEANGVPYVIVRVLSDNADESASADFAKFISSGKEPVTVAIASKLLDKHTVVSAPTPTSSAAASAAPEVK